MIIYQHVVSPSNFYDTVPNPPNNSKGTFSHKYPKDQKQILNKFTLFLPMGSFCANTKIIRSETNIIVTLLLIPPPPPTPKTANLYDASSVITDLGT